MEAATRGRRTVLQEAVRERLVPHTPSSARVGSRDVKSTGHRAGAGEHRVNSGPLSNTAAAPSGSSDAVDMLNERARVGLDTRRAPTPTSAVERGKRREACAGLLRRKEDSPDVKAELSVSCNVEPSEGKGWSLERNAYCHATSRPVLCAFRISTQLYDNILISALTGLRTISVVCAVAYKHYSTALRTSGFDCWLF